MNIFQPVISPSLSPNTESDDVLEAIKALIDPETWQKGAAIETVESWFRRHFSVETAVSFNSGRSALLALLVAAGVGKGDDVLIQAFTCVAVPNSVLWAGATPIYVDIDETLTMDPRDLVKKLTSRSKVIIVQHTFGMPSRVDEIMDIAKKHSLLVIEDCAHSLGAQYKGKLLGTFGDAAFFSFGRDKCLSSVFGGMAILGQKSKVKSKKLIDYHDKLSYPTKFWIFQQLLHPIAFSLILTSYNMGIGKIVLVILQKVKLLSFPVYPEEKRGERPRVFPTRFPNALANLLVRQLSKLDRFTKNRREVATYYQNALSGVHGVTLIPNPPESSFLRFPIFVSNPKTFLSLARKSGILLGNWYTQVIAPQGVIFSSIDYTQGSCPKAEEASAHILNLPTRISVEDAKRVVSVLS